MTTNVARSGRVTIPNRAGLAIVGLLVAIGLGLVTEEVSQGESSAEQSSTGLSQLQEDFTGVDAHVRSRIESEVVETPYLEDFTGVDDLVSARAGAETTDAPHLENFDGVDEYIESRKAAGTGPTPFPEDFTGLE